MLEIVWSSSVCWGLKSQLVPKSPVKASFQPAWFPPAAVPSVKLCWLRVAQPGTPPAHVVQARLMKSNITNSLASSARPEKESILWGFLYSWLCPLFLLIEPKERGFIPPSAGRDISVPPPKAAVS